MRGYVDCALVDSCAVHRRCYGLEICRGQTTLLMELCHHTETSAVNGSSQNVSWHMLMHWLLCFRARNAFLRFDACLCTFAVLGVICTSLLHTHCTPTFLPALAFRFLFSSLFSIGSLSHSNMQKTFVPLSTDLTTDRWLPHYPCTTKKHSSSMQRSSTPMHHVDSIAFTTFISNRS